MIYKRALKEYTADQIDLSGNVVKDRENQKIPRDGIVLVFDYRAPKDKKSCEYKGNYYAILISDLENKQKFIDSNK